MRNGVYTIDSIEKGQAKLLWREDESVEELMPIEKLGDAAKEGDLVRIESSETDVKIEFLKEETESIKEKIKAIKEQLLKRNQ
ncbi:DUF3006 family protein [Domibacillus mangrovi]|uniref:Uncharacterized protein n=1 Tax=Domibacillus mangrovi TaxID=1714354 RepID=A0A1Q5P4K9_9BACI|nr:DUF3006 family protein [Domibacillus mangrovi]OKL37032.1 hypothetical protein BLL40_05430 [Domibacillus mangrovi]